LAPEPASFVVVGMAGFFAAAAKTPISTLIIVSEMTGGYRLLLPTLWVAVIGFMLSDERSIYRSQLESRSRSPAHQGTYVRQLLADVRISQFLAPGTTTPTLRPQDPLPVIVRRFAVSACAVLPVADEEKRLLGVIDVEELQFAVQAQDLQTWVVAEDLMRTDVTPLTPVDPLDRALQLFVENNLSALPILNDLQQRQVIGMVRRSDVGSAYLRRLHGHQASA
jgi:CIC family chloride channel protein